MKAVFWIASILVVSLMFFALTWEPTSRQDEENGGQAVLENNGEGGQNFCPAQEKEENSCIDGKICDQCSGDCSE